MTKRILLAEDEQALARLVELNLVRDGYELEWVTDGEAALAAVRAAPPQLIILDVTMPRMNGFEVLRHLKADPETAEIPVVMLTGRADEESVFKGWSEGVQCYMTKPFDPRDLTSIVERVLAEDDGWSV